MDVFVAQTFMSVWDEEFMCKTINMGLEFWCPISGRTVEKENTFTSSVE